MRVLKFRLETCMNGKVQTLVMPIRAKILTVQTQGDLTSQVFIWAICDSDTFPTEYRKFIIHGTGDNFSELGEYIGTYQLFNGTYVHHVFEVK